MMPPMIGLELLPRKGWFKFLVLSYQDFKDGTVLSSFFNRRHRMQAGAAYSPAMDIQIKGGR